jgi:hypothetical protein
MDLLCDFLTVVEKNEQRARVLRQPLFVSRGGAQEEK